MKHLKSLCLIALFASLVAGAVPRASAMDKPFTEGSVWTLSFIRTTYSMTDDYLKSLSGTYRKIFEEAQKQGLVISYKVMVGTAANKDDWDILLMVEHKNMAALDGFEDKIEVIEQKIVGGEEKVKKLMEGRTKIREVLGGKLVREVHFK